MENFLSQDSTKGSLTDVVGSAGNFRIFLKGKEFFRSKCSKNKNNVVKIRKNRIPCLKLVFHRAKIVPVRKEQKSKRFFTERNWLIFTYLKTRPLKKLLQFI